MMAAWPSDCNEGGAIPHERRRRLSCCGRCFEGAGWAEREAGGVAGLGFGLVRTSGTSVREALRLAIYQHLFIHNQTKTGTRCYNFNRIVHHLARHAGCM